MKPWGQRPDIIAYLFNPAFCSVLLCDYINSFNSRRRQNGMPYSLAFFVFPIILHKDTRDLLPKNTNSLIHPWVQNNPKILIGLQQRTGKFVPYTKETIIWSMNNKAISIENGELFSNLIPLSRKTSSPSDEINECREKARFLGRWFSKISDISMLYILFGVRP
jgi:hypothetical protein